MIEEPETDRQADGDDGHGRRRFLKTVGAAGTAAVVSQSATAAEFDQVVGDGLNTASGRRQESMVVFTDLDAVSAMDSLDLPDGYYAFETLPFAYAELTGDQIREVAGWESVKRVVDNRTAELDNDDSQADTNAREVWESDELGYRGENAHVAVIDTGVDAKHPGHLENVESNYQWVGDPTQGDVVWQDVAPANNDALGHGTHCAGSVCGDGDGSVQDDYAGMAPDATLTMYGAPITSLTRLTRAAAYDHIIAGVRNGDHDIRIVSNSWTWGSEYDPWHPIPVAVWTALQEGIVTLFSAGNAGPGRRTLNETKDPFVLSVAATDADQAIANFSSRGIPDGSHDRKTALENIATMYAENLEPEAVDGPIRLERPGVAAKGAAVMSTQAAEQAYYALGALETPVVVPPDPEDPPVSRGAEEPLYGTLSGTSMSCPTTAGVTALFLDAYYDRFGEYPNPIDTINTIEATARESAHGSYNRINVGAGYVDAKAAVEAALDAGGLPPGLEDGELPPGLRDGPLPPGLAKRDPELPGFDDVELAAPYEPDCTVPDEPIDGAVAAAETVQTVQRNETAEGSPATGSAAVAGSGLLVNQYTSSFRTGETVFDVAGYDGTRLVAEMTWNPTDQGPNSLNLFLQQGTAGGGWETIGYAGGDASPQGENRVTLEVRHGDVYSGENPGGSQVENVATICNDEAFRFAVQSDSGAGDFEITGEFQVFELA